MCKFYCMANIPLLFKTLLLLFIVVCISMINFIIACTSLDYDLVIIQVSYVVWVLTAYIFFNVRYQIRYMLVFSHALGSFKFS